jgi:uncharacterized protein (TIGR03083 family)
MATMDLSTHIAALRYEGALLALAGTAAGADAPVPSCPEWVVRDLVRHLGGVHRWATGVVADARTDAWNVEMDDLVGWWPSDAALIEWFEEGCDALAGTLTEASPDLDCWSFLAAPSPLAFWARRQAHETAIHRVDAELAAGGTPTAFDPPFAADGLDELLSCFITRRGGRLKSDPPTSLVVKCADTQDVWRVELTADGAVTTRADDEGNCRVRGSASDLYQALWNRRRVDDLAVDGDVAILALFLDLVHIRWS